jgi:hypothetical protein
MALTTAAFLVVRNWPHSARNDRETDDRFNLLDIPPTYRAADGTRHPIASTPHVYFFDGPQLTSFPVKMSEDDLDDVMRPLDRTTDYRTMLPRIRQFEVTSH